MNNINITDINQLVNLENVTIYRSGGFGVSKLNAKTVSVERGVKYAQYPNATRIIYIEKGKRKAFQFYATHELSTVVIVPTDQAVPVRDPFTPSITENGMTTRQTRFTSCDNAYIDELIEDLNKSNVQILFAHGYGSDKLGVTA